MSLLVQSTVFGKRTPRSSMLRSIPRVGGTKTVEGTWKITGCQKVWKIGKPSIEQSRAQNIHSSTSKFQKLPTKSMALGN